jgi:adenine-specific DNA methylase
MGKMVTITRICSRWYSHRQNVDGSIQEVKEQTQKYWGEGVSQEYNRD